MTLVQPLLIPGAVAGLEPVDIDQANALLAGWGHYLGPCRRPFGQEAWALCIDGRAVSVAVSASVVSATVAGFTRGQVVELARLCSAPDERWATRPMLRLWREVAAPRWSYWPVAAAVAYSATRRHDGDLYRWDGWTLTAEWEAIRPPTPAHGPKRCWVWTFPESLAGGRPAGAEFQRSRLAPGGSDGQKVPAVPVATLADTGPSDRDPSYRPGVTPDGTVRNEATGAAVASPLPPR